MKFYKIKGWKRKFYFDKISFLWIPPSPNIPDFETCLFEGTNISEGRGIILSFKIFCSDFIELPYEFEKNKIPFDLLVGNSWIRKN